MKHGLTSAKLVIRSHLTRYYIVRAPPPPAHFVLIMGGWGLFNLSLNSWQRDASPLFYEDPYYIAYPSFSNFLQPTLSHPFPSHLQPSPSLFFLLTTFFGLMGDHAAFDVLLYLMIIWIYTWCVFYATGRQVYWGLTHYVVFYWYSDLIWYTHTHTHTHTHTQHAQRGSRLTHILIYIYTTCCVLTAVTFITLND